MWNFLVLFLIEVVGSFQENFTDSVVLIFYEMEKLESNLLTQTLKDNASQLLIK